jgi:hypothetical protein
MTAWIAEAEKEHDQSPALRKVSNQTPEGKEENNTELVYD